MRKKQDDGRRPRGLPAVAVCLAVFAGIACGASDSEPLHFLVANDDATRPAPPSTVTFYTVGTDGTLTNADAVSTGGNGIAGGFFGTARIIVIDKKDEACVYASNAQSENITGIDARERKVSGLFQGSSKDIKIARDGIGLAAGGDYLYATFSGSGNIAAFHVKPGCKLDFVGEIHAQGLSGGMAEGIAVHGATMIATYGDGSVGSYDVSAGLPVAHDDAQYFPGTREDFSPGAVDITRDGHYAIFGGGSTATEVQVSDISSGKIVALTAYRLSAAWGSGSVRLSPDESLLYISNNAGGRVTAAYFDKTTGKLRLGCTSPPLKGFYTKFNYVGTVATELPTGTGGTLYVPEFNADGKSAIGMLRLAVTGTGCTLTETTDSPVSGSPGSALLSIGVYPPRPF